MAAESKRHSTWQGDGGSSSSIGGKATVGRRSGKSGGSGVSGGRMGHLPVGLAAASLTS